MIAAADYVTRETRLSVAINGVLSAGFYLLFFGTRGAVPVWGAGGFAFDFVPQSFAIALMSVLVPGALTRRRLAERLIDSHPASSILPRGLIVRALLLASIAVAAGGGVMAAILALGGSRHLPWSAGALIKIGYGLLLARIVTPIGLIPALQRPSPRCS